MQDLTAPRLTKWPFFLGNILLLALAWYVCHHTHLPLGAGQVLACVVCVGLGAYLSIWPFILEYQSAAKLVETGALTCVVAQVQNIEQLATQIRGATGQWQSVQEAADKTARHAKEIAQGIAGEVKSFNEFLQHSNDGEKAALRLEADKLRRVEADWLQVLVRILDHVHALNRAATQSGQANVVDQLSRFRNICHDASRRVGLAPFVAAADEKFDSRRHQLVEGKAADSEGVTIDETLASGYTFQGKLLRPALVRLRTDNGPVNTAAAAEAKTEAVVDKVNTETAVNEAKSETAAVNEAKTETVVVDEPKTETAVVDEAKTETAAEPAQDQLPLG